MIARLRRLPPRTLSSRLIVMAALTLLIGQGISLYLLTLEQRRQWFTLSVAPSVLRIIDGVSPPPANGMDLPPPEPRRGPQVRWSATPPAPVGHPEPAIAARARELLANAGFSVRDVVAYVDHGPVPPRRLERILDPEGHDRPRIRPRLHLGVRLADGRWLTVTSPLRTGPPPLAPALMLQTLLAYLLLLLPLLWFGRRLSAPLRRLTHEARAFAPDRPPVMVPEQGPADIVDLTHAFNRLQTRIGAMLAEKDHMLGAIGHDLKTPLASLRVRIESVPDTAEREQMAATVEEMRQMLDDILALARIGRDRQPPQRMDLGALAEAVVEDFEAMGADVTVLAGQRAIVNVHVPALRRAIRNLIDNALNYGERARISVGTEGRMAVLRVEDDGPGIDPARLTDMLEPFTRLEESRNRETGGSGLGLALVKAVMRSEGGEVRLTNRSDGASGLVAALLLPLDQAG